MMRLTEKDGRGNWSLKGVSWESLREGQVITREVNERLYGALCKLRDYEDTGLSPDEVERVNNFEQSQAGKLLKRLNEEERKHRWIPIEERLPDSTMDDDGDNIVTVETTEIYFGEKLAVFIENFDTKRNEFLTPNKVIAWRKRPEPYCPIEGKESEQCLDVGSGTASARKNAKCAVQKNQRDLEET